MEEVEQMDKPLRDLMEVIHFTESVSAKIHGLLDETEIYRTVKEEFAKLKRYNASIFLLTDDGSKLRFAETSLSSEKVKRGEKTAGLRSYKSYMFDLNKSSFFSRVVREGKTIEADFVEVTSEFFPRPLAHLITKVIGYEKRAGILTPLKRRGKIIGVLVIDSTELAEHFIPSVKNLAQHISTALELADEHAERGRVEEELIRLSSAVKMSTDSIVVSDVDAKIIDANEATLKMYGTDDKRDLIGKHSFDLIAIEDREKALAGMKEVLEKGYIKSREYRVIIKDGTKIPVEMNTALIKDAGGKPIGFVGISRDISERKRAEEALRQSEEKYRSLVENIPAVIWTLDSEDNTTFLSYNVGKMLGFTPEEIYQAGKNFWHERTHPDDRESVKEAYNFLFTRNKMFDIEYRIQRKDGRWIWIQDRAVTTYKKGGITYADGLFCDITERKRMEEALRGSEEKFRNIFECANDAMIYLDRSGRILDVNKKAVEVFGGSRKEMLGKHFTRVGVFSLRDMPTLMSNFANILASKKATLNLCIKNKKGREIPLECSASLMKTNDKFAGIMVIARDVTERKKTEERIRESEEKYRNLFENARDVIVTFDLKGNVTSINKAVEEYDFKVDEMIGKNMLKFASKRYWPRLLKELAKLARGNPMKGEIELITPKGKKITEYRSNPIRQRNKVVGFQATLRDITERKKMEKALKRQRDIAITLSGAGDLIEALNRLFDNLLEIEEFDCAGFYLVDKDTGALDMIAHRGLPYRFVEKVSHFDADSPYTEVVMEGKPIFQKTNDFPPAIREDLQSDGILAVAAFPIQYEGEVIGHLNMASHTHDEISASTRHVLEPVGAQIGETIVRARMEEKLRQYSEHLEELVQKRTKELLESEKRYSVLVEEASDGVVILQNGKIAFLNKKGPKIVGYSRNEIIGFPFEKLVDEKHRQFVKERYERRLRGEKVPVTYEIELISKTGERVPVEISSDLIHYQGSPADLVIVRDIRERKRMEKERLKLQKLATIGELATMVGHDLRNPLQSIENAVYCLNEVMSQCSLTHSVSIPQKAGEMLKVINDSVNYADKIIADLQDFSATRKPILKKTNLNTIVKETLTQVETPENVKLITELRHLPEIEADKDMIKRISMNLATNGIQAMKNGGKLKVSTKKTKGFVEVSFKDTGTGISKENMKKLFTPFFTTKAKGMGMGLAICKKFIEAHGGTIEVESKEGKGSTFTVKLHIK